MTQPDLPLPVTIIGGYLGAGKTTLVNHMLRHANGRRLAVLVNEFGELSIDEDLIEAEEDDLISIAGGCICCSFGSDLTAALMDLAKLNPRPYHVLIEASGVAIPGSIVDTLSLLDGFQSDGVVVLADAETIKANSTDDYIGDTIERQLSDADIIILSKIDLVDAHTAADLQEWLGKKARNARVIPTRHGKLPLEAVLGCDPAPREGVAAGHADALFESLVLKQVSGIDVQGFVNEIASGSYGVVRAKGFATDQNGQRILVHVVGSRSQTTEVTGEFEDAIICLGLAGQLQKDAILKLLSATN